MYKSFTKITKKSVLIAAVLFSFFSKTWSQDFKTSNVNAFDRQIMNPYSKTLDYVGTGFEALTLLTPAVMLAAPTQDYLKIGVEYAQTIAFAYGAKELAKLCVSRARPYMYFDGAPQSKINNGDWDDSFFSGHATLSFAAAGFTTYMFNQYFPESNWKIPIITASYTLAVTTSALRLASGNHFATDILCGALVGSTIGYLVPLVNSIWFKPSNNDNCQLALNPMGLYFSIKF